MAEPDAAALDAAFGGAPGHPRRRDSGFKGLLRESQGRNLALTVLYVPCSLGSGVPTQGQRIQTAHFQVAEPDEEALYAAFGGALGHSRDCDSRQTTVSSSYPSDIRIENNERLVKVDSRFRVNLMVKPWWILRHHRQPRGRDTRQTSVSS